jgi:hypothetical protein
VGRRGVGLGRSFRLVFQRQFADVMALARDVENQEPEGQRETGFAK